jgi:hypothetical protein
MDNETQVSSFAIENLLNKILRIVQKNKNNKKQKSKIIYK